MDSISEDAGPFLMRTRLAEVATCLACAEQALSTWWDQRQRDGDR